MSNTNNTVDTSSSLFITVNPTMKVVKTLVFEAYLEGTPRNQYRPWTTNSLEEKPRLEKNLFPPLIKHMYEFSKLLGQVVPLAAEKEGLPKGVEILDGVDGNVYPEAMLMGVMVKLNFVKIKDGLNSEDIAYAVKDLERRIKPDEQLVAFAIEAEKGEYEVPVPESSFFKGKKSKDVWFPYVRNGEKRPYYTCREEDGKIIWEDTGKMFFPQKSAWKFLDDKKRIIGNPMMLSYIKDYHDKSREKEALKNQQKPGYVKRDCLGSIGEILKYKETKK